MTKAIFPNNPHYLNKKPDLTSPALGRKVSNPAGIFPWHSAGLSSAKNNQPETDDFKLL